MINDKVRVAYLRIKLEFGLIRTEGYRDLMSSKELEDHTPRRIVKPCVLVGLVL
jgi:hypothetical protein